MSISVEARGDQPVVRLSGTGCRFQPIEEARMREQRAMLDYLDTHRCRMWFLRDQLDDPDVDEATRCGR